MTDNEIIQALECCGVNRDCSGCPKEKEPYGCYFVLCGGAFDLINRQKEENEGLKISVEAMSRKVATARNETVDEYTERLTRSISGCLHCADMQIIRAKMKYVAEQMKNNN